MIDTKAEQLSGKDITNLNTRSLVRPDRSNDKLTDGFHDIRAPAAPAARPPPLPSVSAFAVRVGVPFSPTDRRAANVRVAVELS